MSMSIESVAATELLANRKKKKKLSSKEKGEETRR